MCRSHLVPTPAVGVPESICVVVYEHGDDAVPYGVLTGDTLFIGDVGRPDLLASAGASATDLARDLYRSLREQLLTLPDETRVFPAHGAGSSCGKNLSTETSSTIGEQRRTNYALAPMEEEAFVAAVTEGRSVAPAYFPCSAQRNRQRHALLGEHDEPAPMNLAEVQAIQTNGGVVLDTRSVADFASAHLRGSVNVSLETRFAEYAGDVIPPDAPVAIVCEPGHELEARVRLSRIGFDNVSGVLVEPMRVFQEHPEFVERSSRVTAPELERRRQDTPDLVVLDVRQPGERGLGAIAGSVHVPLAELTRRVGEFDPASPICVYCAGGTRSMIAASVLSAQGFADVSDLLGGYAAWTATLSRA